MLEVIQGRWGVSLDLDHMYQEDLDPLLDGLAEICQFEYHMHTTRSHCPERPRWRLSVPFNKMASVEEAHAIGRLLTLYLDDDPERGIELVDPASFDPNQIMFRPSISKNQEFKADRNRGKLLDVDAFLEDHPGWDDPVSLPRAANDTGNLADPDSKMEDPREKPNPIGPFCRAFDIYRVIEELIPEAYVPSDQNDRRFRYAPADGMDGAVVMDGGLFLHSHHANDPAHGQHNAFDLARIHMFGHLDKDVSPNTSPMNWPSTKRMIEFANELEDVAAERFDLTDMLEDLEDETDDADDDSTDLLGFDDLDDLPDEPKKKKDKADMSWTAGFRLKGKETVDSVAHNIRLICENDPRIAPAIAFNEFTQDPVAVKRINAKKMGVATSALEGTDKKRGYRRWEDGDDIAIQAICSAPTKVGGYEVEFGRDKIMSGVYLAGQKNSFHPVRDMMEECHRKYVGSGRETKGLIEQIPQRWLGCPDDVFHRQSSKYLMLALVARTFHPGHKFDCVTILRGEQGGGKGRFWRTLSRGFFREMPNNFERVDKMVEAMRGALIGELGEMAGLRKETAEIAKAFITTNEDQLRLAYAKREGTYPRRGILTGTSNLTDILHDPTGNRRFWIWVDNHSEDDPIDIADLEDHMDMLYGEAVDVYLKMREEQPYGDLFLDLQTKAARMIRDQLADQFRARSAIEEMASLIEEYLDQEYPAIDVMLDKEQLTLDEYTDDETPMIRNMTTAHDLMDALKMTPGFMAYRNADGRTFGKALAHVEEWTSVGEKRRHGKKAVWWCRVDRDGVVQDGPLWVPAANDDDEIDDLLG